MRRNHGSFIVSIDENIIVATLYGSFNEFDAVDLTEQLIAKIDSFHGKPFCMLINNLELEGLTPEACEEIDSYNEWLNGQNMIAKAFVVNSPLQFDLPSLNIPSKQKQNIKQFGNAASAIEWLESQQK